MAPEGPEKDPIGRIEFDAQISSLQAQVEEFDMKMFELEKILLEFNQKIDGGIEFTAADVEKATKDLTTSLTDAVLITATNIVVLRRKFIGTKLPYITEKDAETVRALDEHLKEIRNKYVIDLAPPTQRIADYLSRKK